MPVPTGVILDSLMPTVIAELRLPTKFCGTAARDGSEHLMLLR
jgi:hypothetical protein